MFSWIFRKVIGKIVAYPVRRQLAAFEEATKHPREVQEALLRRILERHAGTDFAHDHHFNEIRSSDDFRHQMPIASYEYFEPYLARVRRGDFRALLGDDRVFMFALTSGTTAARKSIPVTQQYLTDYKRGWNLWGLKVFRDHPEVKLRPILQMSSDWKESVTEAGIPCGNVTGLTATMQKRIVQWLYCVPACVGRVKDPLAKYYLALRLSVPRKVGMIIAANPSTVVNLARTGDTEKETLLRDLRNGTLDPKFDVPADVRQALAGNLRRQHPERVRELEEIIRRTGTLYPKDYWPKDCLIGNWTGGSVGAYLTHFPRYFGATPVRDIGLLASEGRMTIPVEDATAGGVLDVTSHYFEFIPESEAESANPITLAAHEVEVGKTYYILPTTAFGLYRYHIHDVVRVTGFHNGTPLVEFLSKGAHFANITGEKLSEYHVNGAMRQVLTEMNLTLTAYSLAPCWDDEQPYYGLFVERGDLENRARGVQLTQLLERRLQEANVEYAAKRESLRLGPVRLSLMPTGSWQKWDRARLARTGGNLEQYKHPCLIPDPKFRDSVTIEEELATQV